MELKMDNRQIGHRIKEIRESRGYTQEQLAEKLNLSVQHISVIERGVKSPRLDTFIKIANILEINADYLLKDVLQVSSQLTSNELYDMLGQVPEKEKRRILEVVRVLIQTSN